VVGGVGLAALLLIVLWARSFRVAYVYGGYNTLSAIQYRIVSLRGNLEAALWFWHRGHVPEAVAVEGFSTALSDSSTPPARIFHFSQSEYGGINHALIAAPYWFLLILPATVAFLPWIRWRFTLPTLLIATTLVALVLGLIIAVLRWPAG
jgi:hypothetical protein